MPEDRPVVVTYRRGQRLRWIGLAISAVIVTFFVGRYWDGQKSAELLAEKLRLENKIDAIESELLLREEQLRNVLLSSEVDQVALENTRQQMVIMQRQIHTRDEDLRLYRDLLQDNDSPSGLSVSDFNLQPLDPRRIRYRWVARQKNSKMRLLSVYAYMEIHGKRDGTNVVLSLSELNEQVDTMPLKIEFKYFSIQQGILRLPANFEPYNVRISLKYTWETEELITQDFAWKYEV